jgi:hypothetical protein
MFPVGIIPEGIFNDLKKVVKSGGSYSTTTGLWSNESEITQYFKGRILPITNTDLQYDQSGTYTTDNMKLYTYENFDAGQQIIDENGVRFKIDKSIEYSSLVNFNRYILEKMGVSSQ